MKYFTTEYQGEQYELWQKTQKREKPMRCDGCDKRIRKGMYFSEADAGECYCLECSTE